MHSTFVIARREWRSYFDSPIAYMVVVAFLLVAGFMFFSTLFLMNRADMRSFFQPNIFSPSMLLVILAPAVTMRLLADERKSGTLEFLLTLPVSDWNVVLGKYMAALGTVAVALACTLFYAVTVSSLGTLDWGTVASGYIGMLLFAAALLAVGLACSSVTENQIVAFIVGFFLCAALYFVYWLQFFVPTFLAPIVEFLSLSYHLENLARGVLDTRDVVYFLTIIVMGLVFAERQLAHQHA